MKNTKLKKEKKPRKKLTPEQRKKAWIHRRKNSRMSENEKRIAKHLRNIGVIYEREYCNPALLNPKTGYNLFIDFYLPDLNIAIEFDGSYHYSPVDGEVKLQAQKERDKIKNKFCIDNKIWLLRIPFFYRADLEKIISEYIERVKAKENK